MPDQAARPLESVDRHSRRRLFWGGAAAVLVAAVFLALPALAGVPARLVSGCGDWIAAAGGLELLSAVGFVMVFKLVFAPSTSWRRSVAAALRALGATTILPGGGLIGPTMGAWSSSEERPSLSRLTRATTTFVILTNAPGAVALAGVGTLLWLGLLDGPHQSTLTILPAVLAAGLLVGTRLAGRAPRRHPPSSRRPPGSHALVNPVSAISAISDGIGEARVLITTRDWKLLGTVALYVFDNAVLWAAFHAFGRPPAIGVIVMGYLIGSLAGALPLPGGIGAVDGGLIGALVLYGAPAAPAAAAVLLYRALSLAIPVALGAVGCTSLWTERRVRPSFASRHHGAAELASAQRRW